MPFTIWFAKFIVVLGLMLMVPSLTENEPVAAPFPYENAAEVLFVARVMIPFAIVGNKSTVAADEAIFSVLLLILKLPILAFEIFALDAFKLDAFKVDTLAVGVLIVPNTALDTFRVDTLAVDVFTVPNTDELTVEAFKVDALIVGAATVLVDEMGEFMYKMLLALPNSTSPPLNESVNK